MIREPFVSGDYYHVYNRGVDKRKVFLDYYDFERFYESMYLFNDENFVHPGGRFVDREFLLAGHEILSFGRKPFVSILAFCLNDNHFHLLLQQILPDGISKFLHRLGMGYANYFNLKHGRKGRLWENSFKAKPIDFEEHLQLLPRYIHLNVLDRTSIDWRNNNEFDWTVAEKVLNNYPWSSHGVYIGRSPRLPVVDREAVQYWFSTPEVYLQYLKASRIFGEEELTFSRL